MKNVATRSAMFAKSFLTIFKAVLMSFSFSEKDIKDISKFLDCQPEQFDSGRIWKLNNESTGQALVVSLHDDVNLGSEEQGSLVSVQTQHGYFELHACTGYVLFEPDEVIFVQSIADKVSCLIVGQHGSCSMYTNISRAILSADFTTLDSPVLLSAMQLSLIEGVIA
ncbi:MAG: hypothetical protein KAH48_07625 [Chlorobi bacterium]|nr:hypothetical protein [Chlorobiota bacterium]